MTVKDLLSRHYYIRNKRKDVIVVCSMFDLHGEYIGKFDATQVINTYGNCHVDEWFETRDSITGEIIVDINIKLII